MRVDIQGSGPQRGWESRVCERGKLGNETREMRREYIRRRAFWVPQMPNGAFGLHPLARKRRPPIAHCRRAKDALPCTLEET